MTESKLGLKAKYSDKILISARCLTLHSTVRRIIIQKTVKPLGNSQAYATFSSKGESYVGGMGPNVIAVEYFRAENRKKHARTLRERGTPKVSKMAVILIFLFSTIYYATADIPVSSDNFPTQEDTCRYNLAVVRLSCCFLKFKKRFQSPRCSRGV